MKFGLRIFTICLLMATLFLPLSRGQAQDRELVLLDTDMVELFDDGVAMMMLAEAPNIKLIGVTTSTGNSWAKDGAVSAIRQLEGIDMKDVPVAIGDTPDKIRKRLKNLKKERDKFGGGFDLYIGAAAYQEPEVDWIDIYKSKYGHTPLMKPVAENAVDFMIRLIKENPEEVTIVEIGPQTNLAAAIKKAPEIIPLIKRVVYMGGAFFQNGNVTPAAEFNIWFDPEAAKKVIRAPFREVVIVPLDACEKIHLTRAEFNKLCQKIKSPIFSDMVENMTKRRDIFAGSDRTFIWDILAAAVTIDHSIVNESIIMPVDINDVYSPSYGETLAYRRAPQGARSARLILKVDQEKIENMLEDLFSKM